MILYFLLFFIFYFFTLNGIYIYFYCFFEEISYYLFSIGLFLIQIINSLNTDYKSLIKNKNSIKNNEREDFSEFYNTKTNQNQNNSFSPNNTDRNNNPNF